MIEHPCSAPRALALAAVFVAAAGFSRSVRAAIVQPKSDLKVVLTRVTPGPAYPGQSVVFHASVTNLGPDAAPNVFLSLVTPVNASLGDGGGPAGWNCIETTDLVCSTASLAAGATATPFVVEFQPKDTSVTPMVATATVASDDLDDENPENNTSTVETDVVAAAAVPVSWKALSAIGLLLGAAGVFLVRR